MATLSLIIIHCYPPILSKCKTCFWIYTWGPLNNNNKTKIICFCKVKSCLKCSGSNAASLKVPSGGSSHLSCYNWSTANTASGSCINHVKKHLLMEPLLFSCSFSLWRKDDIFEAWILEITGKKQTRLGNHSEITMRMGGGGLWAYQIDRVCALQGPNRDIGTG